MYSNFTLCYSYLLFCRTSQPDFRDILQSGELKIALLRDAFSLISFAGRKALMGMKSLRVYIQNLNSLIPVDGGEGDRGGTAPLQDQKEGKI